MASTILNFFLNKIMVQSRIQTFWKVGSGFTYLIFWKSWALATTRQCRKDKKKSLVLTRCRCYKKIYGLLAPVAMCCKLIKERGVSRARVSGAPTGVVQRPCAPPPLLQERRERQYEENKESVFDRSLAQSQKPFFILLKLYFSQTNFQVEKQFEKIRF